MAEIKLVSGVIQDGGDFYRKQPDGLWKKLAQYGFVSENDMAGAREARKKFACDWPECVYINPDAAIVEHLDEGCEGPYTQITIGDRAHYWHRNVGQNFEAAFDCETGELCGIRVVDPFDVTKGRKEKADGIEA